MCFSNQSCGTVFKGARCGHVCRHDVNSQPTRICLTNYSEGTIGYETQGGYLHLRIATRSTASDEVSLGERWPPALTVEPRRVHSAGKREHAQRSAIFYPVSCVSPIVDARAFDLLVHSCSSPHFSFWRMKLRFSE